MSASLPEAFLVGRLRKSEVNIGGLGALWDGFEGAG